MFKYLFYSCKPDVPECNEKREQAETNSVICLEPEPDTDKGKCLATCRFVKCVISKYKEIEGCPKMVDCVTNNLKLQIHLLIISLPICKDYPCDFENSSVIPALSIFVIMLWFVALSI